MPNMTDPQAGASPGFITIARHGLPACDRHARMDWRGYETWWEAYDRAGLAEGQTPPASLMEEIRQARTLFASTLPRAIETARAAGPGREVIADPVFLEAPLPPPPLGGRYRAKTWGVYARTAWWLGHARGLETRQDAERRAAAAAAKLTEAAAEGGVVLCAHGWFNRMIRPELRARGWRCVRDGGDVYWSFRRYEYAGR